jgi:uncharacterized membrane protein YfcA
MKRWALAVIALYLLLLMALVAPPWVTFVTRSKSFSVEYADWSAWLFALALLLCQLALLWIPVQQSRQRPVTRRSLWPTVLVSGLLTGVLVICGSLALIECLWGERSPHKVSDNTQTILSYAALAAAVLSWVLWSIYFWRLGRNAAPIDVSARQSRWLIRGSILELLIAVPAHIVIRQRNTCCAVGISFMGLTMGIAVMLCAFGPAVYFLFLDRWRRRHPQNQA